jgi:hypothetical protein
MLGPDPSSTAAVRELGGELHGPFGQQVPAQRAGPGMPAPPSRPAAHPPLRGMNRVRAERRLQPVLDPADLDAQGAQRGGRVDPRPEGRSNLFQVGAGGLQVQAGRPQQPGGRTVALPQHTQQQVFVRQTRMAELARLGVGQPDHLPAVRGQPSPEAGRPILADRGGQQPDQSPPDHGCTCARPRTRSPCL